MLPENKKRFVMLVVLDGWGIAPDGPGNAISLANTPNMDRYLSTFPNTRLGASGESVGLPRGEVGNTETGHLNLGAGRIIYQDLNRINMSIADGSFANNHVLLGAIEHAKNNNSNLHLMGLVGAGGVHSNIEHLFNLIRLAADHKFDRVFIHAFTDGRDSPPKAALTYIEQINKLTQNEGVGKIASIMGRYWAMDRDKRWERTARAYKALTSGDGHLVKSAEEAIRTSYEEGRTDEFIEPSIITNAQGEPLTLIKDDDAVIFFNFRIDRPRQLSRAFVLDDLSRAQNVWEYDPFNLKYEKKHKTEVESDQIFDRGAKLQNLHFCTMTEYSKILVEAGARPAFPPETIVMPLGAVISEAGLSQLRATETEKERFVTFYFNGQRETPFPNEERLIVPSPGVETYDKSPEMSCKELTDRVIEMVNSHEYAFVLINYPNPDMVGHTGNITAAIKACEAVDMELGRLYNLVMSKGGTLLITADHGNVEEMINVHTGGPDTDHSEDPVPFVAISNQFIGVHVNFAQGILADVAPTVLGLLGLNAPSSMMGRNLLTGLSRKR